MKSNLLGKKVRGTNAYGKPVGEIGTVVAVFPHDADRYGNYVITVEYADGRRKNTRSFWVRAVDEF
jgi:hypothetical protein